VCEETDGRLQVDAGWPAIATLRDPIFYLSGPPQMLAALTAQLGGRGVEPALIHTDAWE
jgi:ferredoxin-NADP reductase